MPKVLKPFIILALLLQLALPVLADGNLQTSHAAPFFSEDESPYVIHLLNGALDPAPGLEAETRQALIAQGTAALSRGLSKIHVLLQLFEIPTDVQREALAQAGVELHDYIPHLAWIAAVPADHPERVADLELVRWMGLWNAEAKLHPNIRMGQWGEWAVHPEANMVMIILQLHHDVPLEKGSSLAEKYGGVALPPIEGIHGMTVWLPPENVPALAKEEEVLWIEEGPAPLSPNNDGVLTTMQVTPLYSAPYNLNGSGVRVFVFDGGTVRTTHNTFNPGSRVTMIDDAADVQDHPTHVAGTVAGDGDGGRAQGVAPAATILSAEYEQTGGTMLFWDNAGDIQADYANARNNYNADFGTNSIGSNTAANGYNCAREGDYGVSSNMLDGIVRGDNAAVGSAVLMTWANGNERTGSSPRGRCGSNYLTTAPPSCAKNPIHIGAINSDYDSMTSFSSWGPCDDGRMKPIVSAPGCELGRASGESFIYSSLSTNDSAYGGSGWCGTSMATPAVAGVVALMIQDWRALGYGGANDRPLPALVKAWLMHTARDLGQDGPDYIYGYGEVDAKAAVDLIRSGTPFGTSGPDNWGSDSISNEQTDTFSVYVPADMAEFKVSLAWDDYAAPAFSSVALINNLNLELVAPDSTIYRPWVLNASSPYLPATTGVNTVDNQEQVVVTNPMAGTWTIRVVGAAVPNGPQSYALVSTMRYPIVDNTTCAELLSNGGFETASDWTLSGATRDNSRAYSGTYSLKLGGATSTNHSAYQQVTIPSGVARAELSFWWYMTTNEGPYGHSWDYFYAEVRNTSDTVLATFDYRSDGWQSGQWMKSENMDLTPWAGQTVRVYFYATNDSSYSTTFWVDDVSLVTCAPTSNVWWIGKTTSWNSSPNWSNGSGPTCTKNLIIPSTPAGGNYPTLDINAEVKDFTLQTGAIMNMAAHTLGVCGNWSVQGTGQFNGTGGTVVFKGSSAQTISMLAGSNGYFYHLQIGDGSTTQTVSPNTNLDINGNLNIMTGATLNGGSYNHQLAGSWTRSGTFNAATGSIAFDGSGTPTINGDTAFYNITVGSGVTLTTSANVTVGGVLTNNGWTKETKAIGSGSTSYGLAQVTVNVTTLGSLSSLEIIRRDQNHPQATGSPGNSGIATGKWWRLTPNAGASGFTVNLTLPHNSLTDPKVCKWPGGLGGSGWDCDRNGYDASTVWRNGIGSFSDWAVGQHVGPTAIYLRSLAASSAGRGWLPVGLLALALGGLLVIAWRRCS